MAGIERRSATRHKTNLDLRFSYRKRGSIQVGWGRLKDISNQSVCFESDINVPFGTRLEVRIPWPKRLQDVCDLELIARGSLVKNDSEGSVLRIEDYELRTCGGRSFDQAAAWGSRCNVVG